MKTTRKKRPATKLTPRERRMITALCRHARLSAASLWDEQDVRKHWKLRA